VRRHTHIAINICTNNYCNVKRGDCNKLVMIPPQSPESAERANPLCRNKPDKHSAEGLSGCILR